MQRPMKRKYRLSDDLEPAVKRTRLDSLLENLSLDSEILDKTKRPSLHSQNGLRQPETERKPQFSVNPMVDPTQPGKTSIDSYISEKLFEGFKERFYLEHAVIRWVPSLVIIAYHFERWVRRLFNQFVRRFNENHPDRPPVKRFTSYAKIVRLVQDPSASLTVEDLWNILMESNKLERKKLALKRDKRSDSKKVEEMHEEEQLSRESQYGYWDRFRDFGTDVVMEESVYEPLDMDMDVE